MRRFIIILLTNFYAFALVRLNRSYESLSTSRRKYLTNSVEFLLDYLIMTPVVARAALLLLSCVTLSLQSEMFTGNVHMQRALYTERAVAYELREYVKSERSRIDAIER